VPFRQDTSVLMVGERTNANGSKKFREAMLAEDWETCVGIARDQTREGAHLIDLCVDYVGRDGVADMAELAGRLATASTLPVMLDSTEPEVLRAGLGAPGRALDHQLGQLRGRRRPGSRFQTRWRWPASTAPRSSRCASTRRARPAPRSGRSAWPTGSSAT
jgi:5-methyltetrahydrofolate--homocysteine methyltransferase